MKEHSRNFKPAALPSAPQRELLGLQASGLSRSRRSFFAAQRCTRWQVRELKRRERKLAKLEALLATGMSQVKAAKQLRLGIATIWRWRRRIMPATDRCGRDSMLAAFGVTESFLSRVALLQLSGLANIAAWKAAASLPECPPALAKYVRMAHTLPLSFRRATKLTSIKAIRGPGFVHINQTKEPL